MTKLTKSQKKQKHALIIEATSTSNRFRLKEIWDEDYKGRIKPALSLEPKIWPALRSFGARKWLEDLKDKDLKESIIAYNDAINDSELSAICEADPLRSFKSPGCGDLTLKKIARMWHENGARNIDCVPIHATKQQIQRMYELVPECENKNATLEYAEFCQKLM